MSDFYLLLTPLLVLGVLALAGFVGCDVVFGLSSSSTASLVVDQTLTTQRNDFTGWVGMVVLAANDTQVAGLGRYRVAGSSLSHDLKIVDSTTGQDVPGSHLSVDLNNGPDDDYVFADYPSGAAPTLSANKKYYILSSETGGGDIFFDFTTAVQLSQGSPFVVPAAVFGNPDAPPYTESGGPGNAFGPVNVHLFVSDG